MQRASTQAKRRTESVFNITESESAHYSSRKRVTMREKGSSQNTEIAPKHKYAKRLSSTSLWSSRLVVVAVGGLQVAVGQPLDLEVVSML